MKISMASLFKKIADFFGVTIQPKSEATTDFDDSISITATLCDRLTTLTLMDSSCDVVGDNQRSEFLQDVMDYVWNDRLSTASVVSLGTGDCLLKPCTDGNNIAVDIISNNNFVITESIGNIIKGCIIKCDEYKEGIQIYQRMEYHSLKRINGVSYCFIKQMAFKNEKPVPLTSVNAWADIQEDVIIPNCDKLLFGRIKCPKINKDNPNGVDGVPITYGADEAVKAAKEAYSRYNQEFSDKETLIFGRKYLFKNDPQDGKPRMPKGKERLVVKLNSRDVEGSDIDTYSPEIRDASLQNGIETNLRMVEMFCGLSNNVLTKPTDVYHNQTEIRNSLNQTFAFMTSYRGQLEKAIDDLMYAINILCNANNLTPMGDYTLDFDWSDKLMESSTETFNQLLQLNSIRAIEPAEIRAWTTGEDYDEAKRRVIEIKEENPVDVMLV